MKSLVCKELKHDGGLGGMKPVCGVDGHLCDGHASMATCHVQHEQMQANVQERIANALCIWMRCFHASHDANATADALNTLALAQEDVARVFLEAAANVRHAAWEKECNELFREQQRRSEANVTLPVGFERQAKREVGFQGAVEVWKHPRTGDEIRIARTDNKAGRTKARPESLTLAKKPKRPRGK